MRCRRVCVLSLPYEKSALFGARLTAKLNKPLALRLHKLYLPAPSECLQWAPFRLMTWTILSFSYNYVTHCWGLHNRSPPPIHNQKHMRKVQLFDALALTTKLPPPSPSLPPRTKLCWSAAFSAKENPHLPVYLFAAFLTTPIRTALFWCVWVCVWSKCIMMSVHGFSTCIPHQNGNSRLMIAGAYECREALWAPDDSYRQPRVTIISLELRVNDTFTRLKVVNVRMSGARHTLTGWLYGAHARG